MRAGVFNDLLHADELLNGINNDAVSQRNDSDCSFSAISKRLKSPFLQPSSYSRKIREFSLIRTLFAMYIKQKRRMARFACLPTPIEFYGTAFPSTAAIWSKLKTIRWQRAFGSRIIVQWPSNLHCKVWSKAERSVLHALWSCRISKWCSTMVMQQIQWRYVVHCLAKMWNGRNDRLIWLYPVM